MDNDKRFGINALKIAALIGVGLFTTVQAQAIEDYTGTYGTGSNAKYYQWVTDANGNRTLQETTEQNKDIVANYETPSSTIGNPNNNISDTITGEFIGLTTTNQVYGPAIYTNKTQNAGNINGIFIGNYLNSSTRGYGGAIANNKGTISNITADFIANTITSANGSGAGGAISNDAKIGDLNGNFIGNGINATGGIARGGFTSTFVSMGNISGDFIGNYAISNTSHAYGGAINNAGTILNIESDFTNNYVSGYKQAYGGAIANASGKSIGKIHGDFTDNYAKADDNFAAGGAIANDGTITEIIGNHSGNFAESIDAEARGGFLSSKGNITNNIEGNFTNNHVKSTNSLAYGGAIYSGGVIGGDIKANFTQNYATATKRSAIGGAIYNSGTTGDIIGNQSVNYVTSIQSEAEGGFLYNKGVIGDISGKIENNYAQSTNSLAYGGAIFNNGKIENITADFDQNYTSSTDGQVSGGAIYNNNIIDDIAGTQTGNYVQSINAEASGGLLSNTGEIKNISGNISENYAQSTNSLAYGGAIFNDGKIENVTANFSNNRITTNGNNLASGGAIANDNIIGDISGTQSGNYAKSTSGIAHGGFLASSGEIGNISGKFENNYAQSTDKTATGGAIYILNGGTTKNISANFSDNYVTSNNGTAAGGAISVYGKTEDITGNFSNNTATSSSGKAMGGAIHVGNTGNIKNISGNFDGNYAKSNASNAYGGAIYNERGKIGNITANFTNTTLEGIKFTAGGVIANDGTIENISGIHSNNSSSALNSSIRGGFISSSGTITNITGSISDTKLFSENGSAYGGAIYNSGTINNIEAEIKNTLTEAVVGFAGSALYNDGKINNITGDFIGNKSYTPSEKYFSYSGALYNYGEIGTISSSFIDNIAISNSEGNMAFAGAVFTEKDLTFLADGKDILFSGNYTQDNVRGKTPTAIFTYVGNGTPAPTITLKATNNGTIQFDDAIDGGYFERIGNGRDVTKELKIEYNNHYNLKIDGDETTTVNFNNYIKNANIIHNGGTTNVNAMQYLSYASGEGINSLTMNGGVLNIGSLGVMPLGLNSFAINGGTINIDNVQVDLANQTMGRISAENYGTSSGGNINIASMTLLSDGKDAITPVLFADESFKNNVTTDVTSIMGEVYKYDVTYDTTKYGPGGHFVFARSSENIANYNPSAVVTPVAAQAGAQVTQLESLYTGFAHIDRFTKFSHAQRQAMINANKYAIHDLTTIKRNSIADKEQSVWAKPYTGFESISLRGGLNVSATSYGSIFGGDSGLIDLGKGYTGVISSFVGYNGSHLSYNGININNNGGVLGFTGTLYKGNFFTGLTASTGASAGEGHTYFGTDHFTMLSAGVANKTGYNFEFNDGKLIIQPQVFVGYTFVNTFDYTAASGVKMESDPLHSIQIVPGVRVIGNLGDGWQPYASVNMVWNIMDKTKVKANDAMLPQLSMKPYVEYGVGLQKTIGERFTGYFQSMIRNGGRTGVVLSAGFKWAIGKDTKPKSIDTVNKPTTDKKVLKSKKKLLSLAK